MRRFLVLMLLAPLTLPPDASADPSPRFTAALQTSYQGTHPDLYAQQQDRIRQACYGTKAKHVITASDDRSTG